MRVSELAKRYGRALYSLASEIGQVDAMGAGLKSFSDLIASDRSFAQFAGSPLIRGAEKELVLQKALAQAGVKAELQSFLLLLARKGRLGLANEVHRAFVNEQDHANGVVRGRVVSARKISETDKGAITELMKQVTGKKVSVEFEIDENVVAGVRAEVGSLTIDDSVSGHMKKMRDELNRRVQ